VLLLLVLLVLLPIAIPMAWVFASSSSNPTAGTAVRGGSGSCTQLEELWLQAQAVPSASRIPCVQAVPAGIRYGGLRVRNGESVLQFDRGNFDINVDIADRPRLAAESGTVTIRLAATCAVPTAAAGQAVAPGVTRFQLQGARGTTGAVDVFPGGCVTYALGPDGGSATAALLDQAQRAVTFRTRDELREALRRRSDGRLHLDPAGGT
jgi:hypothetical protein